MANPRIGQPATLNKKPVVWSGQNYGWQSPATHKKLAEQGKFRHGTQALDRLSSSANRAIQKHAPGVAQHLNNVKADQQRLAARQDKQIRNTAGNRVANAVQNNATGKVLDAASKASNVDRRIVGAAATAAQSLISKAALKGGAKPSAAKPAAKPNTQNVKISSSGQVSTSPARSVGAAARSDVAGRTGTRSVHTPARSGVVTKGGDKFRENVSRYNPTPRKPNTNNTTGVRLQNGERRITQIPPNTTPPRGLGDPISKARTAQAPSARQNSLKANQPKGVTTPSSKTVTSTKVNPEGQKAGAYYEHKGGSAETGGWQLQHTQQRTASNVRNGKRYVDNNPDRSVKVGSNEKPSPNKDYTTSKNYTANTGVSSMKEPRRAYIETRPDGTRRQVLARDGKLDTKRLPAATSPVGPRRAAANKDPKRIGSEMRQMRQREALRDQTRSGNVSPKADAPQPAGSLNVTRSTGSRRTTTAAPRTTAIEITKDGQVVTKPVKPGPRRSYAPDEKLGVKDGGKASREQQLFDRKAADPDNPSAGKSFDTSGFSVSERGRGRGESSASARSAVRGANRRIDEAWKTQLRGNEPRRNAGAPHKSLPKPMENRQGGKPYDDNLRTAPRTRQQSQMRDGVQRRRTVVDQPGTGRPDPSNKKHREDVARLTNNILLEGTGPKRGDGLFKGALKDRNGKPIPHHPGRAGYEVQRGIKYGQSSPIQPGARGRFEGQGWLRQSGNSMPRLRDRPATSNRGPQGKRSGAPTVSRSENRVQRIQDRLRDRKLTAKQRESLTMQRDKELAAQARQRRSELRSSPSYRRDGKTLTREQSQLKIREANNAKIPTTSKGTTSKAQTNANVRASNAETRPITRRKGKPSTEEAPKRRTAKTSTTTARTKPDANAKGGVARDAKGKVKTAGITVTRSNGKLTESSRGAKGVYRTSDGKLIQRSEPVGKARQRSIDSRSTKTTKQLNNAPVNTSRPTRQTAADYASRMREDKRRVRAGGTSKVADEAKVLKEMERVQRVQTSSTPGANAKSIRADTTRAANDRRRTATNTRPPAAGTRNLQADKSNYGPGNNEMPNRKAGKSESTTKVTKTSVSRTGPTKGTLKGGDVKTGARGELGSAKVTGRPRKYDKNGNLVSKEAQQLRDAVQALRAGKRPTKAQIKALAQSELDQMRARTRRAARKAAK